MYTGADENRKSIEQLRNVQIKQSKTLIKNECEDSDDEIDPTPSFQKIRDLFRKTEEMKELAKEKNKEVEDQFQHLKERLNGSSVFLNQMKSSIENLRFSFQRKMIEQKEDYEDFVNNKDKYKTKSGNVDNYIEEVRGKIEKLQTKPKNIQEHCEEPQDYQSVLKDIVTNLKIIDQGLYSSQNDFDNVADVEKK